MADKKKEVDSGDEIWVTTFDEEAAQTFRERVLEQALESPDKIIVVHIDSYGGYVDSLAKMIETMQEVPNKFVTVAMGKAVSCGAILLSMGDARFCGRLSRVMVHRVSAGSWGDVFQMKSQCDESMRVNQQFMALLAENCGKTYDELEKLIRDSDGQEIWMDAKEALAFGIVDYVGTPKLVEKVDWQCQIIPEKVKTIRKSKKTEKKIEKKVPKKEKKDGRPSVERDRLVR